MPSRYQTCSGQQHDLEFGDFRALGFIGCWVLSLEWAAYRVQGQAFRVRSGVSGSAFLEQCGLH